MLLKEAKKILKEAGYKITDIIDYFKDPSVIIVADKFGDYDIISKETKERLGVIGLDNGYIIVSTADGNAMYKMKDINKAVEQFYKKVI